jgi:hypothetical protein
MSSGSSGSGSESGSEEQHRKMAHGRLLAYQSSVVSIVNSSADRCVRVGVSVGVGEVGLVNALRWLTS